MTDFDQRQIERLAKALGLTEHKRVPVCEYCRSICVINDILDICTCPICGDTYSFRLSVKEVPVDLLSPAGSAALRRAIVERGFAITVCHDPRCGVIVDIEGAPYDKVHIVKCPSSWYHKTEEGATLAAALRALGRGWFDGSQ